MQTLSLPHCERSLAHFNQNFFVCLYIETSAKANSSNAVLVIACLCTQSTVSFFYWGCCSGWILVSVFDFYCCAYTPEVPGFSYQLSCSVCCWCHITCFAPFCSVCTSTHAFLFCLQMLKSQGSEKKIVVMTCKIVKNCCFQQIGCLPTLPSCLGEGFQSYFIWDICFIILVHHT